MHTLSHLEEHAARKIMTWLDNGEPVWEQGLSAYFLLEDVVEFGDENLIGETVTFLKKRVSFEEKRTGNEDVREPALHALAGLGAEEYVLNALEEMPENPGTHSIREWATGEESDRDLSVHNQSWQEFVEDRASGIRR